MVRFLPLALAFLALGLWPPSAGGQGAPVDIQAFLGVYRSVSIERDARVIDGAITNGTEEMFPLRRVIVRQKLISTNVPVEILEIAAEGGMLVIRWDGDSYVAPLDGGWRRGVDPDGESVNVSHRVRQGRLVARYVGDDGEQRVTFSLSDGGQRLRLAFQLISDWLPATIRYGLDYRRR